LTVFSARASLLGYPGNGSMIHFQVKDTHQAKQNSIKINYSMHPFKDGRNQTGKHRIIGEGH
jgi:hypothetical protein